MSDIEKIPPVPEAKEPVSVLSSAEKIELLENQIHALNIKINAPDRSPWWKKNASLVISILALVTTITVNVYNAQKEKRKEVTSSRSTKIEKIGQLTLKLTELAEKNFRLSSENPNVNVNGISVLLNYQRLLCINEITSLMEEVDTDFPSDIYALIGTELKNDGQFSKARDYYGKELLAANTPNERVIAYRDLGSLYGVTNTPISNKDSSDHYWKKSIEESDSLDGEQRYHFKGYGYQLWAGNEFYFGNVSRARVLIDSAKMSYLKLPDFNPMKHYSIAMLSQMIEMENQKEVNKTMVGLVGEWSTRPGSNVKARVYFSKNLNGIFCNLVLFEGDKPSSNLSGSFVSSASNHMTFMVQGMKRIPPPVPYMDKAQVFAIAEFTALNSNDYSLKVKVNGINGEALEFLIYKT